MDGFPLRVSIDSTQSEKGLLGLRHTNYVVHLDDCGKVYSCIRRFANFVWLHCELQRKKIADSLPTLPPKKAVGNMDANFVVVRKRLLQEYLLALLLLPAVIHDDTLWAFLDADPATIVVPRFLYRLHAPMLIGEMLTRLEMMASREAEVFRLCSPAVITSLVSFLYAEASMPSSPSADEEADLRSRLRHRVRMCSVLAPMLKREQVRGSVNVDQVFEALTRILCEATELGEQTEAAEDCLQVLVQESKGEAFLHFCVHGEGLEWLRTLMRAEVLHLVAARLLWNGLQHSGVVVALGSCLRLLGEVVLQGLLESVDVKAKLLGALCLSCLLRHETVLSPSNRARGYLRLAEVPQALDAEELRSFRLSTAVALTQESTPGGLEGQPSGGGGGGLSRSRPRPLLSEFGAAPDHLWGGQSQQERAHTFSPPASASQLHTPANSPALNSPRLSPMPSTSSSCAGALSSTYSSPDRWPPAASTGISPSRHSLPDRWPPAPSAGGHLARTPLSTSSMGMGRYGLAGPEVVGKRDSQLVDLLRLLCRPRGLPRLQKLLLGVTVETCEGTRYDTVSALVVCVLDHFTSLVSADEDPGCLALAPLVPQLQRLLAEASVPAASSSQSYSDTDPYLDMRVRAARVLLRIWDVEPSSGQWVPSGLPTACRERAQAFNVLMHDSERWIRWAKQHLADAQVKAEEQATQVKQAELVQQPCLRETVLGEFRCKLVELAERRKALHDAVRGARQATEVSGGGLDQNTLMQKIFKNRVDELEERMEAHVGRETEIQEARALADRREELSKAAKDLVEQRRFDLKTARAEYQQVISRAEEAEMAAVHARNEQVKKEEILHQAPAQVESLQREASENRRAREALKEQVVELNAETEHEQLRVRVLRHYETEADSAIESLRAVRDDLESFRKTLNSELVLSDEEVQQLRRLEMDMKPARPSRLRLPPKHSSQELSEDLPMARTDSMPISEPDAPSWDEDVNAEHEFCHCPDFRQFRCLYERRADLWSKERWWLQDVAGRAEGNVGKLTLQRRELERQVQITKQEEDVIENQIAIWANTEEHERKHQQSIEEAEAAHRLAQAFIDQVARAASTVGLAEERLAQQDDVSSQAESEFHRARKHADSLEEDGARARAALEKRCAEVQADARLQLQGWKALELQNLRLELLQQRVDQCIEEEALGRRQLQAEARNVLHELRNLSRQLGLELELEEG